MMRKLNEFHSQSEEKCDYLIPLFEAYVVKVRLSLSTERGQVTQQIIYIHPAF